MARRGFTKDHTRRSKYGKVFRAGRGRGNVAIGHKDKKGKFHPHNKYQKKGIHSDSIQGVHPSVQPTGITTSRFLKNKKLGEQDDLEEAYQVKELEDFAREKKEEFETIPAELEKNQPTEKEPPKLPSISSILTDPLVLKSVATGLTLITGNPLPIIAVKIFSFGDYASRIIDYLNKNETERKIALAKEIAGVSSFLYKRELKEISKKISNAVISSGYTNQLAQRTNLNVGVVNGMFENTIQDAIQTGLDKLPSVMVDVI